MSNHTLKIKLIAKWLLGSCFGISDSKNHAEVVAAEESFVKNIQEIAAKTKVVVDDGIIATTKASETVANAAITTAGSSVGLPVAATQPVIAQIDPEIELAGQALTKLANEGIDEATFEIENLAKKGIDDLVNIANSSELTISGQVEGAVSHPSA